MSGDKRSHEFGQRFSNSDQVYPEITPPPRNTLKYSGVLTFAIFALFVVIKVYALYAAQRPASLDTIMRLHASDTLSSEVFAKHMYSMPKGQAIKPILEIADSGNMHAQNMVCWAHLSALNVEADRAYGAKYCHKSAAQGYSGAHNNLGIFYNSNDVHSDLDKAIYHFTQAADERSSASVGLAQIYTWQPEPIRDYGKALYYKKMAIRLGDVPSLIDLGDDYFEGRIGLEVDYSEAINAYTRAKKLGHMNADHRLAELYRDAAVPYQNYEKMHYHFHRALNLVTGIEASIGLGDAYRLGLGVEKNIETAAQYYAVGAEAGHEYAILRLSGFISTGEIKPGDRGYGFKYKGTIIPYTVKNSLYHPEHFFNGLDRLLTSNESDPVLVSKIYEYYADELLNGNGNGQIPLNQLMMIHHYSGYKAEFQPVVQALETLAMAGDAYAAYALGAMYTMETGVTLNTGTGVDWVVMAMEQNHPDIRNIVAFTLSQSDEFISRETEYARSTLQHAAVLGSKRAAMSLADIYRDGVGVPVDSAAATYWYKFADDEAWSQRDTLKTLRQSMNSEQLARSEALISMCTAADFIQCSSSL